MFSNSSVTSSGGRLFRFVFWSGVAATVFMIAACSDDHTRSENSTASGAEPETAYTGTKNRAAETTAQSTADAQTTNPATLGTPWLALTTVSGLYSIRIDEDYSKVPTGEIHHWDLTLYDAAGHATSPSHFALSGTMPGHGHGMTTFPEATVSGRDGAVRVNGMTFHMSGNWRMKLALDGPAGQDQVTFDIVIAPPKAKTPTVIEQFTDTQLALLKSVHIDELPELSGDPSNRFSQNPMAIALGAKLFTDQGLSGTGKVACATCHDPTAFFADGLVVSRGSADTQRHAPSLIGLAWQRWFYWDGRRDSLWAQALTPIETTGEMDSTRVDALRYVLESAEYQESFQTLTGISENLLPALQENKGSGPFSDEQGKAKWYGLSAILRQRINHGFADIGKIIAAYEETLVPEPSTFDRFVTALIDQDEATANGILNASQRRGAVLFADAQRTHCLRCHNGPLFSNREFHNIATGENKNGVVDFGRVLGIQAALLDPFNCTGDYSDAPPESCHLLRQVRTSHTDTGAFKTPSLRNVSKTAPYMHDGRFSTLADVMAHYLKPSDEFMIEHEMPELRLSDDEVQDLIAFLGIL